MIKFIALTSMLCVACPTARAGQKAPRPPRDPETGIVKGAEPFFFPGEGDAAVLLIHGFSSSPREMYELGKRLNRAKLTVSGIRLKGHGTTVQELRRSRWEDWYADSLAGYEKLRADHKRVFVAGFSLGALLASRLAADKPVDALVLLAPALRITYKWYYVLPAEIHLQLAGRLTPYVPRFDRWIMVADKTHLDEYIAYTRLPPAAVRELVTLAGIVNKQAPDMTAPLLAIHSKNDQVGSPRALRRFFSRVGSKEKELLWLERSNHIITLDHDRERVFEAVRDFLLNRPQ
ncbi:MAG: alpha/beta fold hydrolase [Elusimicrobiota bacterium]